MNLDQNWSAVETGQISAQGGSHSEVPTGTAPSWAQLPPKARFTHAYKQGLLSEPAHEPREHEVPNGGIAAPSHSAHFFSANAPAAVPAGHTSHVGHAFPSNSSVPALGKHRVRPNPRRAAAHFGLGDDDSSDWEEEEGKDQEHPEEDLQAEAAADLGPDPLRRGAKAARLSVSAAQGRAEHRRPRIGPQYQAFIPSWPTGL